MLLAPFPIRVHSRSFAPIRVPKNEKTCPSAGLTEDRRWRKAVITSGVKTGTGLAALQETIE